MTSPVQCPVSECDPYAEDVLRDPYPHYAALRAQGGVVYLSRYALYALPRYQTTHAALMDWATFSSAHGVMLNDVINKFMKGTLICSDPPEHDVKRGIIMRPITVRALREISHDIATEADLLAESLCSKGQFDAVTELAQHLPLKIVATRVGLPPVERSSLLRWGHASFDCTGPLEKPRTQAALSVLDEINGFLRANSAREKVAAGSWLEGLYRAADAGEIPHEACPSMSIDYIGPSLDTTISALSSAIWLFATFPDQWERLRQKPSLLPNAINEIVRLESPIQGWTRYVVKAVELDGVSIPVGSRVLIMFGSANRDERKWEDPEKFDVTRHVSDHLGFGAGEHACAGSNLARMEIHAVLSALLQRVRSFELAGEVERDLTQVTRTWRTIAVRVHRV